MTITVKDDDILSADSHHSKIAVYPNPTTESIHVTLSNSTEECTLEIFSIWGKKVYATTIKNKKKIETKNLIKGTYIVVVSNKNNEKFSKKIIVK